MEPTDYRMDSSHAISVAFSTRETLHPARGNIRVGG